MYGVHPDLVFVAIQAIRKAKLGDEYSHVYDENGTLISQRLDIPDYDPTIPFKRRWAALVAPTVWPAVRRLAPFRLIVSREEVTKMDAFCTTTKSCNAAMCLWNFLERSCPANGVDVGSAVQCNGSLPAKQICTKMAYCVHIN